MRRQRAEKPQTNQSRPTVPQHKKSLQFEWTASRRRSTTTAGVLTSFGFTPHDGERNSVSPSNARSPSRHLASGLADGGPDVSPGCGQPCPAGHEALAGRQESKNLIVGAGSGLEPLTNPA